MVKYYEASYEATAAVANERLSLQADSGNIVEGVKEALGTRYAGVWFDNESGHWQIGELPGTSLSQVQPYLTAHNISDSAVELVPVQSSVEELLAAQVRINERLMAYLVAGEVSTGIYEPNNAVIVRVSTALPADSVSEVHVLANSAGSAFVGSNAAPVAIEMRAAEPSEVDLQPVDTTCANHFNVFEEEVPQVVFCNRPLRGGVTIWDNNSVCSLGFIVTNGPEEFIMTAGHCLAKDKEGWFSAFANFNESKPETWGGIGEERYRYRGELGDFGTINLLSGSGVHSPWFPDDNPSTVADLHPGGGGGEDYLENIAWSAVGDITCRTGGSSDTQCGEVLSTANTEYVGGVLTGYLTEDTACAIEGDSGGTVFGNHSGLGMLDAINVPCGHLGAKDYYTEAVRDAVYSGVEFYVPW